MVYHHGDIHQRKTARLPYIPVETMAPANTLTGQRATRQPDGCIQKEHPT